jgi:hypothetical protein
MRGFWIIGGFGISLFFGLASIPPLRMYFRTRMRGLLFSAVGAILVAFSFLGITIWYMGGYSEDSPIYLLFFLVMVASIAITFLASVILNTNESGLWKELGEKTTFWQRLTGNIPILKYEKPPPPTISMRTGLIIGISAMTLGSLVIILYILFKITTFFSFLIAAIGTFIFGLLFVIFSIIYLDKGKKLPEKNK